MYKFYAATVGKAQLVQVLDAQHQDATIEQLYVLPFSDDDSVWLIVYRQKQA